MNKNKYINTMKALSMPVIVYIAFLIPNFERFGTFSTINAIFLQSLIPAAMGYGLAMGWISGIFDFTMGSRIIISAATGGILSMKFGLAGLIIGCLVSSVLIGLFTGIVNWLARIPALVATLGLAMIYEVLSVKMVKWGNFARLSKANIVLGTPVAIMIIFAICAVMFYFVFYHTKFSYQVRAMGNNQILAKNMGINIDKMKVLTFAVGGLFLGVTALMQISVSGAVSTQLNLQSGVLLFKPLMGVIIGLALEPLCNLVLGIFIGTFSVTTIFIGLIASGLSDTYQNIALGLFVLAVMFISENKNLFKNSLAPKRKLAIDKA